MKLIFESSNEYEDHLLKPSNIFRKGLSDYGDRMSDALYALYKSYRDRVTRAVDQRIETILYSFDDINKSAKPDISIYVNGDDEEKYSKISIFIEEGRSHSKSLKPLVEAIANELNGTVERRRGNFFIVTVPLKLLDYKELQSQFCNLLDNTITPMFNSIINKIDIYSDNF